MSTKNKSWKHMSEQDFTIIKTLQNLGVSQTKIIKTTGRGSGTVQRAMAAETFEGYVELTRAFNANRSTKPEVVVPTASDLTVEGHEEKYPALMNVTDVQLERIANALERMADAWEAAPAKRKLF